MNRVLPTFVFLLALTACAPLSIYHRTGVTVSRMQNDLTNCQVRALKDAPVANQIRQSPPVFVPGRRVCTTAGCKTLPGFWRPGNVYTVDANLGLRTRVEAQCMGQKAYQPVQVKLCQAGLKSKVPQRQTQILPTLSKNSCALRYKDGSWQIVNRVVKP